MPGDSDCGTTNTESVTYDVTLKQQEQIDKAFTYHPPNATQVPRYNVLRDQARSYAGIIVRLTPPGREQALALTKLEEAVMWANAAIARGE